MAVSGPNVRVLQRVTGSELARIENEQRAQTQLEPAHDYTLMLVAEVHRLRDLINDSVTMTMAPGVRAGQRLKDFFSEADAIREEKKA